jgi:hypothetical protein
MHVYIDGRTSFENTDKTKKHSDKSKMCQQPKWTTRYNYLPLGPLAMSANLVAMMMIG